MHLISWKCTWLCRGEHFIEIQTWATWSLHVLWCALTFPAVPTLCSKLHVWANHDLTVLHVNLSGNVKPPRSHCDSRTLLSPMCFLWRPWTQCGFHYNNRRFSVTSHPPQEPLDSCVLPAFLQTDHSCLEAMNSSTLYLSEFLNSDSSFSDWYPGHMLHVLSESKMTAGTEAYHLLYFSSTYVSSTLFQLHV